MQQRARVNIGRVIEHALVFDLTSTRGKGVALEPLRETAAALFALLSERQIPYVLAGGITMLVYVEGRNTEDINLILSPASLKRLPEMTLTSQEQYFARGSYSGWQVDVLLTSNQLFETARQCYTANRLFDEGEIPCATVEGLVLLKLYALPSLYRQGNFARVGLYENDIATLLHDYSPNLEPLLNELTRHLSSTDIAAVRDILEEIRQRIERFDKGAGTER